jgi:ribosomal protein S18 acetylase RimI-like enzyme
VLSISEVPVAHIQFIQTPRISATASPTTLITGWEVQKEYRGWGCARLLCEYLVAEQSVSGDVWVAVDVSNVEAVGLYTRMGFIEGTWYNLNIFSAE